MSLPPGKARLRRRLDWAAGRAEIVVETTLLSTLSVSPVQLSKRCAALAPRVAAVLEGGYNVATLPRLVSAALEGFSENATAG